MPFDRDRLECDVLSRGAQQSSAPESLLMCRRSRCPASGGTGTDTAPASRHPSVATTVSTDTVASIATTRAPCTRSATAAALA